jgi:CRP/FNR family cyclic AMP-dependent transcriptional regulator
VEAREALAKVPLFSRLKRDALDTLARSAKVHRFDEGELIVKEGDDAVAFYALCDGEAEVVKHLGQEGERVLGRLNKGEFFGEMALIDGFPRSATVRAVTECECLVLSRWDFLALVRSKPEVALGILPVLSLRLREFEEQVWR